MTEEWVDQYNEERSYDALGDLTSFEYREAHLRAPPYKVLSALVLARTKKSNLSCIFSAIYAVRALSASARKYE